MPGGGSSAAATRARIEAAKRRRQQTSSTTGREINYPSTSNGVIGGYASPALARAQSFQTNYPGVPYTWDAMRGAEQYDLENVLARNAGYSSGGTTSSGGSGYSYGYGGGGGGGGGGSALTQAMIDAMAKALGAQAPQITLESAALPAFQGQALGAFNAQPYTQALGQINQAVAADQANIAANQAAVTNQLNANYSNPYATATVTQGAPAQTQGAGLAATVGGTTGTAAADQTNAANADSQAAFSNLLKVLAAADTQAQQSRMAQVGMDANYARQGLDATALGLRGGVNTAQAQAANQWRTAQEERNYQNSLLAQQYAREDAQRRQEIANQQAQLNYQTNTTTRQSQLQAIMDLIAQSAGTSGLNFDALFRVLGVQ